MMIKKLPNLVAFLQRRPHTQNIKNPTVNSEYDRIQRKYGGFLDISLQQFISIQKLQKAMDGVIHAMSLVVETRDPYTAGHQRRVAELARAIAREMGLSEWQTKGIHIAGLLHDVGKVSVPSEILSKPGKISQHEFSLIKTHCLVGHEILQRLDFPWPVIQAILQHHERLNGSGYPEGLARGDIILEARILAVADVVEAMSSHRPYRPALGLERALQEISQASGILYDSEVVDACLNLLKKNEPEFDRLMAAAANHEYAQITVTA